MIIMNEGDVGVKCPLSKLHQPITTDVECALTYIEIIQRDSILIEYNRRAKFIRGHLDQRPLKYTLCVFWRKSNH